MKCGAMDSVFALLDYAEGLHVPDKEWDDPRVQQLRDLCNKSVIFMNDVYSFEKELHDQNGCVERLVTNLVAYHVVREGMSIKEAIVKMVDINGQIEIDFQNISEEVFGDDLICNDTKQYIQALKAMIPGNILMSTMLNRYNTINYMPRRKSLCH
jgi:hypothetical protein